MQNVDHQLIKQIQSILENIAQTTGDMSERQFLSDDRTQDLVTAGFDQSVKLARKLSPSTRRTADFPRGSFEGLENVLQEALFEGDDEALGPLLWETIEEDLPFLQSALQKLTED